MDLSVVIPCYREESHLRESVRVLCATLAQTRLDYELIFVDDCSPDATREVITAICDENSRARYIFHSENKGRGGAFKTGFSDSKGDIVGFIDIDLEVAAHYIPPLVNRIRDEGYDVATGKRIYLLGQTRGWLRHFLSSGYRSLCHFFLNYGVKDSETGIKFFLKSSAQEVVLGSEDNGWFWDTEVMARAALANLKIIEVPVLFLRRFDKESTVNLFSDSWKYIIALYYFRKKVGLGMSDRSPIYWTAIGYDIFMRLLCGGEESKSLSRIGGLIPKGSSVSDLCCGTARLYRDVLQGKGCRYLGLDANGHFILSLRRRGINVKLHNVLTDEIDPADYVVMCNSFYHFYDKKDEILAAMRKSANKGVIISEPVKNISSNSFSPLAALARILTNPGIGDYQKRFDLVEFRDFAQKNGATEFIHEEGSHNALAFFNTRQAAG